MSIDKATNKSYTIITQAGFGLIELMVSIGIMVFVLAVILVDYGSFNGAVLLRNQAFEIALSMREAQQLAVSTTGSGTTFRNAFGVYFDPTIVGEYIIFQDQNGNDVYDATDPLEFVSREQIDLRFEVRQIVANPGETNEEFLDDISITFLRPNFDARFNTSGTTAIPSGTDVVVIGVALNGTTGIGPGEYREVRISSAGQIDVQ